MAKWVRLIRAVVIWGLMCPSPIAWAQLADVDPVLHAAVEALVTADPEVAGDPELAQLCRAVAEATIVDVRERAAVTNEVATLQREGVDINTIIPEQVREAARETYTRVQGEMQQGLETLRATDPERAKEVELMMREGERQMQAFESGERYAPSPEMMEHARDMFGDWKEDMLAQGAPPEFVARAEFEFSQWTGGEMAFGGPGHELMGPGHEFGGPMPTVEQMQTMGMSAEQIQMAQAYSPGEMPTGPMGAFETPHGGGSWEQYGGALAEAYVTEVIAAGGTVDPSQVEHFVTEQIALEIQSQSADLRQDYQSNITTAAQERFEIVHHNHPDSTIHDHTIHVHADGARHDHTQEGSGL